ncbi:hypothetical protein PPERSA_12955 [Pseudocohnilembus persalinus]|uniref:Uncharacterized protein n=1 Tax=Pseudocohnilembus persalinus TaxID=266149 RepID=A0A0V0R2C5_PSEPJ|nr:hypothetical protein PPERSA_12955 [Pseudocohnilembus persalinus]|eukprot:KRX08474.1 hypothetical protein PPERSA_12955 [Pseudocohnilembus persalinus]
MERLKKEREERKQQFFQRTKQQLDEKRNDLINDYGSQQYQSENPDFQQKQNYQQNLQDIYQQSSIKKEDQCKGDRSVGNDFESWNQIVNTSDIKQEKNEQTNRINQSQQNQNQQQHYSMIDKSQLQPQIKNALEKIKNRLNDKIDNQFGNKYYKNLSNKKDNISQNSEQQNDFSKQFQIVNDQKGALDQFKQLQQKDNSELRNQAYSDYCNSFKFRSTQKNQNSTESDDQQQNQQQQKTQRKVFQQKPNNFNNNNSRNAQYDQNQYRSQENVSVQKLMFGNQATVARTKRSRSNQENDSNYLNNIGSSERCVQRGCFHSLSPLGQNQNTKRYVDFEFINGVLNESKVINDLMSKHGKTVERSERYTDYQSRTEEEYLNQKSFPFKPKINDLPRDIYNWNEKSKLEISKEEQWERLLKGKREIQEEREIQKINKEAQDWQENCSFKPQVNQISQMITKRDKYQQDVTQRLYSQGLENKKKGLFQLKQDEERKFLEQHPFQPDVEASVQKLTGNLAFQKPLHQRVEEVINEKQEQMMSLQIKHAEDTKCPFKPEINKTSALLAEQKLENQQQPKDVVQRLMTDAIQKAAKIQQNIDMSQYLDSEKHTFHPSVVSEKNEQILKDNILYQKDLDFSTRQQYLQDQVREKLQKKMEQLKKEQNPHKPQINMISKYLMETDEQRENETQEEKNIRLAKKDKEKQQLLKEQLSKAYYDQYPFKPNINSVSKALGPKSSINKLIDVTEKEEKLKQKQFEKEQKELEGCSFQPRLNEKKKYKNIASKYNVKTVNQALQEAQIEKEKKIEQLKQMWEYEQLKECTFQPQINSKQIKGNNIEVKGMDKYMQYRELHKKQIIDQKERESKVFNLEKKYDASKRKQKTEPKDFKLSKGNPNKLKQLRQELLEKEREECTFKPQTNYQKDRELINKILELNHLNKLAQEQNQNFETKNFENFRQNQRDYHKQMNQWNMGNQNQQNQQQDQQNNMNQGDQQLFNINQDRNYFEVAELDQEIVNEQKQYQEQEKQQYQYEMPKQDHKQGANIYFHDKNYKQFLNQFDQQLEKKYSSQQKNQQQQTGQKNSKSLPQQETPQKIHQYSITHVNNQSVDSKNQNINNNMNQIGSLQKVRDNQKQEKLQLQQGIQKINQQQQPQYMDQIQNKFQNINQQQLKQQVQQNQAQLQQKQEEKDFNQDNFENNYENNYDDNNYNSDEQPQYQIQRPNQQNQNNNEQDNQSQDGKNDLQIKQYYNQDLDQEQQYELD